MAVDNVQSSTPSKDTWEERLEFYLYETLCRSRAKQLFDLIATFPDSIRALGDLRICLEKTDEKLMVARELSSSLRSRLLHPGAHTRDIIQLYVHMVRSLREIDPSGIILSRVVSPLRKYLRSRKDTISVVVSSLLGDDPNFTLLRDELEDQDEADEDTSRASANRRNFQHHPSAADPRGREEEEEEDEDWLDSTWVPRPVDAGPNYRMSRSKDVIGMLVSVFNDKEGFVAALEKSMSEQLIRVKNYDAMKEYRNNMILKKRFGETSLGRCDVMLGDIADSRRINNLIQSTISTTDLSKPTYRTSNRSREEEERKGAASLDELPESFSKLRPIIISRQFWPDLTKSSKSNDPSFSGGSRLGWIQREEDDDDDEDEDEIEEDGRGLPRHLSRDLKRSLEIYGRSFNQKKSMRRLKWFKRLMRVEIEIESESGSKVSVECRPFQANVLEVATGLGKGGDDGGEAPPFSIEMVSEGISRSCRDDDDGNEGERSSSSGPKLEKVLKALRFWCRKGLLAESNVSPGLFRLVEFKDHAEVEDVEM
ncbi:hypothetical protein IE53DRAFT_140468 [Violaceomyces palustris]|uniref:Uncharacterized protein n=1 Tax=Violaceomyces palustris TaxID=1673888 RepID=A0ACD0P6B1_9BASI|nr:hypothetical protein IE53DRAFT_140468 [Violaceomyces palustris]